jgi:DNA mismatch endonuclease (patch repair protein)
VVFVDGCFWHTCPRHSNMPKSNRAFWEKKLSGNQARDKLVTETLRKAGWQVIRLWEHDLVTNPVKCIHRIRQSLRTTQSKRKTRSAD